MADQKTKKMSKRMELYHARKAAHLCTSCGATLPKGYRFVNCEACKASFAKKQRELREAGICASCAKRPALPKGKYCAECKERMQKAKEKRKEEHLCTVCSTPLPAHYRYLQCMVCRERGRVQIANKRAKAREQGLCTSCYTNPVMPGTTLCAKCAEKTRIRSKEARDAMIDAHCCTECGKALPEGHPWRECTACREKRSEIRKEQKSDLLLRGICQRCHKNEVEEGKTLCYTCLKKLRDNNMRKKDLCQEQHICVTCGTQLEEGYSKLQCPKCMEKHSIDVRMRRKRAKVERLCPRCLWKPLAKDETICSDCRKKMAAIELRKKNQVRDEQAKALVQKRIEQGLVDDSLTTDFRRLQEMEAKLAKRKRKKKPEQESSQNSEQRFASNE